jgi:uncharacterized membrane protein YqaE (UPF0057 family)
MTMKRSILLAVVLAAAGMLLSACGHSYRFIPMHAQEGDRTMQQQPAQSNSEQAMTERADAIPSGQDAAAPSDYNRNVGTVAGMQQSAEPASAKEAAPLRSADRQASRGVHITPRGSSDISAESADTHAIAAAAPAPLSPRSSGGVPKWFLIVCAIFLPPLAVALVYGISDKFWIDLLLTFCFWIPGVIYALIVVM